MTSPSRSPTSPTLSNPTSSPQSLTDSAIGGEYSTSPEFRQVVDFRDEGEEILESFGEKEMDFDSDVPDIGVRPEGGGLGQNGGGGDLVRRHSWLRTSLRRSSPKQDSLVPPKRWGSFRVPRNRSTTSFASALYQTGNSASFNSSGRSSNCDDGELQDIHSDISIEDDVIDLNNKVHQLQAQVGILAENQQTSDDRYTRVKQENAALTTRIHMLEEHIREIEVRSEERIQDELKRSKELLARLEREKELQLENYAIRNSGLEQEVNRLKEENVNLKKELERTKDEKRGLETQMVELQREVSRDKEERRALEEQIREERELWQGEQQANNQHIQELSREIAEQRQMVVAARQTDSGHHSVEEGDMLAELPARIADMEGQIRILRDNNKRLEESNEELQAQMLNRGLDEGRKLLSESEANNSLAAEFEAMSENEMRKALQEQQDVNRHLRGYIDNVLLNIMEKYPEILEIRAAK